MSKNTDKQVKTRHEMTKAEWTWFLVRKNKTAYFMVLPFMFIFVLFTVVPVVASLALSFTQFNMLEAPKFVFMDNYIKNFSLEGKVALVTGASYGIGFAIASGMATADSMSTAIPITNPAMHSGTQSRLNSTDSSMTAT